MFAAEFWSKSVVGKIRARSRESTSGLAVDVGPEVGSRLPALAVENVWPGARVGVVFGRLSQEGGVGDFWKVFPVLIDYPELRLTRRAQYENCDSDWQCARPFIPFWQEGVGVAKSA